MRSGHTWHDRHLGYFFVLPATLMLVAVLVFPAFITLKLSVTPEGGSGGNLTLIGNVTPKLQVNLQEIISREVTIRGSAAIAGEYPACLNLIAQGRLQVTPLTRRMPPLAEGQASFDALHHGAPGRMKTPLRP